MLGRMYQELATASVTRQMLGARFVLNASSRPIIRCLTWTHRRSEFTSDVGSHTHCHALCRLGGLPLFNEFGTARTVLLLLVATHARRRASASAGGQGWRLSVFVSCESLSKPNRLDLCSELSGLRAPDFDSGRLQCRRQQRRRYHHTVGGATAAGTQSSVGVNYAIRLR